MRALRNLLTVGVLGAGPGVANAIIVGDPAGSPADAPANHVDPNVTTSPYGGVVSINVSGVGPASGVLLRTPDPNKSYVLTAGHVVDPNRNGGVATSAITVALNYSGNFSSLFGAAAFHVNAGYYTNPASGHDDLAVLELTGKVPAGVPTYNLLRTPFTTIQTITLVGYGETGNGVAGITAGADTTVKRVGQNRADAGETDDDAAGVANEIFLFDFDRPNGSTGPLGGPGLGNTSEVQFGVGDSGGPAFVAGPGGELLVFGINTFGVNGGDIGGNAGDTFPKFGSGGGGQVAAAYASFIDPYVNVPEPGAAGAAAGAGLLAIAGRRRCRTG